MEDLFIPFEQALALKELGFDEPCLVFWTNTPKYKGDNIQLCITDGMHGYSPNSISFKQDFLIEGEVLAPLYQQAFKFFREKYGLSSCIHLKMSNNKRKIWYNICELDNRLVPSMYFKSYPRGFFKTYEEAELECIKKLIEIVKNDKNL